MFGELLIRRAGFGAFFIAAMALVAIGASLTWFLPGDRPTHPIEHHETSRGPSYLVLMRDAGLQPLWLVTLLFSFSISARLSFVAPFAYQKGIATVGGYFFIYSIVGVASRVFGRRILDRVGLGRVLLPSLVILAIGMAMIAGTGHTGILDIAAAIGGVGHGYVYPALSAMVIMRTSTSAMGRSSSIYTSLYDAGTFAGPYLLGLIGEDFGYGPLFLVAGAVAWIAAVYFLAMEPQSLRASSE
jgi:predicted MFS family arabinose efflux permease